jgi:hypothetical protein
MPDRVLILGANFRNNMVDLVSVKNEAFKFCVRAAVIATYDKKRCTSI